MKQALDAQQMLGVAEVCRVCQLRWREIRLKRKTQLGAAGITIVLDVRRVELTVLEY